jgi:hypothetical protein
MDNPVILLHCLQDYLHPVERYSLSATCHTTHKILHPSSVSISEWYEYICKYDAVNILEYYKLKISITTIARTGALECLRYLYPDTEEDFSTLAMAAVQGKSIDCLVYLHQMNKEYVLGFKIALAAIMADSLPCLQYILQQSPWSISSELLCFRAFHYSPSCYYFLRDVLGHGDPKDIIHDYQFETLIPI